MDGLEGIVIADRDGVPVLEGELLIQQQIVGYNFYTVTVSTGMCPPNVLKPIFLGAFSLCSEQVSLYKCQMNKGTIM